MQPPSINQVEELYSRHESDFCAVSVYLASIADESALIKTDAGDIRIGFADEQIVDPLILVSLRHLWKAGCSLIYMDRAKNSIKFELWKTGMVGDADAGILYALDPREGSLPTTQYLTEISPLQSNSWYYYVADYEQWRNTRDG